MPTSTIDLDAERADLLAMHAAVRQAHFDTDPAGVVAYDAEQWINVRDGKVAVRRRAEDLRFEYAGVETYEKREGRWLKVVEAGTFEIK